MRFIVAGTGLFLILFGFLYFHHQSGGPKKLQFSKREKTKKYEDFSKALEDEIALLRDPATGRIPAGVRERELQQAGEILQRQASLRLTGTNVYTFQGPDNMGGRTRSIVFDVSDPTGNTILSGSVSGGVFRTTNGGASWTRVNPSTQHFSVTSLAQDTRPGYRHIWYYGGGESIGNSAGESGAFYLGDGVYKSVDGGNSWSKLTASNTGSLYAFDSRTDLVSRLAVHPVTGDVYLAALGAIMRSQDGGSTWSNVLSTTLSSSSQLTDITITPTGRIYAAFSGVSANGSAVDGVWTSLNGNTGSWSRIAGTGAEDQPAGWNAAGSYGRLVIAYAPSNEQLVYALYDRGTTSSCTGGAAPEAELYRWDLSTETWTDLSATLPDEAGCSNGNDPFAVQSGYNLCVAVKPDNPNVIFIGGTNIYRSTNGGGSWTRIGGYANATSYSMYANHHPDIHTIVFGPVSANLLYTGDDGGIHRADISAGTVSWTSMNNGYNTYQYYHVAIKPETGNNDFIGGAQDNGTSVGLNGATTMNRIISGDGVSVGLASGTVPYTQFCGSQRGGIYRRRSSLGAGFIDADLTPSSSYSSIFITYFLLDPDNTNYLYYAAEESGSNRLLRLTHATTALASSWQAFGFSFNGYIRSMATTRGAYSAASRLYMGTSTGKIYRLTDPVNAALGTAPDLISSASMPAGTVIGLAVNPSNHNELLAVYSNYGIVNIWHTFNAGAASPTWTNIEGNLTLPSIRSCMIIQKGAQTEYYVGTSIGLYKTSSVAGSVSWVQEAPSELGNILVTSLSLRTSDNTFAIGTHGMGMWKGVSGNALPVEWTHFDGALQPDHTIALQWGTSTESGNRGFEVERSHDGRQFKMIGFVKGNEDSRQLRSYYFHDKDLAGENNYYRLRQLDADGSAAYSTMILVRSPNNTKKGVRVLNNPFSSHIDIEWAAPLEGNVLARLVDMEGRVVASRTLSVQGRRHRFDVSSMPLARGQYVLHLSNGKEQHSSRLVRR